MDYIVKTMLDGTLRAESTEKAGVLLGDYETIPGEFTEEEFKEIKTKVVDSICGIIREIAEENDDFFIVKKLNGVTTVGAKVHLPTVNKD